MDNMSIHEIETKARELRQLQQLIEEAQAEAEAIRDQIKAHMADVTERNAENIRIYLSQIARIIEENKLRPFDRTALAWLVDLGSHLCEDQRRLSLKFPLLRELMIEAAALAEMRRLPLVSAAILEEAYAARTYRANLVEEIFMEEYDREMIKVRTSGSAVGQVNGLSVTWHGDFEFGLPHRISCTVGVGHEGIIDLERGGTGRPHPYQGHDDSEKLSHGPFRP